MLEIMEVVGLPHAGKATLIFKTRAVLNRAGIETYEAFPFAKWGRDLFPDVSLRERNLRSFFLAEKHKRMIQKGMREGVAFVHSGWPQFFAFSYALLHLGLITMEEWEEDTLLFERRSLKKSLVIFLEITPKQSLSRRLPHLKASGIFSGKIVNPQFLDAYHCGMRWAIDYYKKHVDTCLVLKGAEKEKIKNIKKILKKIKERKESSLKEIEKKLPECARAVTYKYTETYREVKRASIEIEKFKKIKN